MAAVTLSHRAIRVWQRIMGRDALSEQVRRTLVRSLYTQPTSLAIGAINGIVSTVVAAWVSGSLFISLSALLLSLIVAMRVWSALRLAEEPGATSTRQLERLYLSGAYSYAFALGVIAAATVFLGTDVAVQALMLANAIGYGIGICARNAGRPTIAMGQLALSTGPIMLAALWQGSTAYVFMALTLALLLPAMASIVAHLFQMLRDSIAAAETSRQLADKMQSLARSDVVTGLANRAGLNHAMVERLKTPRGESALALFWIDLDRFKEVNDLFGHQTGDRVLAEFARRLREVTPADATIARFGGDEFIVFCEVADRRACETLSTQMLDHVTRPMRLDHERLDVPASMGIALLPDDADSADTLMQSADLALYHAKTGGKNRARFFDRSMSRNLVRRREIEAELRAAIQRDELSIFFQPIVDLATGHIRTFEALVRWFHPEKGELRPDEFIPVAEETGLIVTLGNWITAQAARAAAQWPAEVTVAVNLSPLQIKAPGAALGIMAALRDAGLPPSRLELEVTESLFVDDTPATRSFIEELSAAGVRFALDDFGTGYSSLAYIHQYPFSKIKVDRSFVSGPNVGRKSEAIIHAVAEMGARLDMAIVAEGLETIDQVNAVRAAGCTQGQGFYFSRAVPDYLAAMLLAQERDGDQRATG